MYKLEPIYGDWSVNDFPDRIEIDGQPFVRAIRKQPYSGVIEQYREEKPRDSMHLLVLDDGRWRIDHVDDYNPDMGHPVRHFLIDHPVGKVLLFTGAGLITGAIAVQRGIKSAKVQVPSVPEDLPGNHE